MVKDLEEEARACYEDIDMQHDKFLQMLLLDSCLFVHHFRGLEGILPSTLGANICSADSSDIIMERTIHKSTTSQGNFGEQCSRDNSICTQRELVLAGSSREVTSQGTDFDHTEELESSQCNNWQIGTWFDSCIEQDLKLLENQIPFFIVRRIYELFAGNERPISFLTDKVAQSLENFIQYHPRAIQEAHRPKDFHHMLHLFQMYLKPSKKLVEGSQYLERGRYFHSFANICYTYLKIGRKLADSNHDMSPDPLLNCFQDHHPRIRDRRAVQYHQAGVQFKKKSFDRNNPHSLLDISFDNGTLMVPYLFVDQSTVSHFRNLIAFEQTCPQFGNDVTAYSAFMSFLLCRADDIAFLGRKGIIVHHLCSDGEVSAIFAKLGKNVDFDLNGRHFLKHVCHAMEEHYQSRINRWLAWLWQHHFSNPWLSLAVVAAAIVLLCTIIQTLLALLAYLKSTNGM